MMKRFLAVLAVALAPSAGLADGHISEEKALVLGCLELVGDGTEWTQCVGLMFSPCADHDLNSDAHNMCLLEERDGWREAFRNERAALTEVLTPAGTLEMNAILDGWVQYADQKCQTASLERGGAKAALYGCEIAEVVSATQELVACRAGRSTAPFCVLKDPQ